MKIWAIADLHLSFGTPGKTMDLFGPAWKEHPKTIEKNWREVVSDEDLVLIAGDISWAMKLTQALPDLEWIESLPGKKAIIRGNHDYWWSSISKMKSVFPASIEIVQNNALSFDDVSIGGARLWDTPEFNFEGYIHHVSNYDELKNKEEKTSAEMDAKIFERELGRLEMSLKAMDPNAQRRVIMTHYPPIGPEMQPTRISQLLEQYGVDTCVFGHLHNVKPGKLPFGEARGVKYHLTSCDYINFKPIELGKHQ